MGDYQLFEQAIKNAVSEFTNLDLNKPVKIIGNYDSDGLSAAAILVRMMKREGIKFSLSIIRQLNKDRMKEIMLENYDYYIFSDLGSGCISLMEEYLKDKFVLILDHHKPERESKFIQINPCLYGLDGGKEISASGVAYLFAKMLNEKNAEMAHIALIGAIGDIQENKGFEGLNKMILDDAINNGKIEVKQGLRMFGIQTRPLHKILEYSEDPYIPGVTGSENGAIQFLNEIGIEPKSGNKWKKLVNLDNNEMRKLVTGVILRRLGEQENPDDVLGPVYVIKDEDDESPTRDAKEFSTLLNACGRMNKPSLGVGTCLGNKQIREEAIELLREYKRLLINAMEWFYNNKKEIIENDGYVIINAKDRVNDAIIGTLASMLCRNSMYKDGTIIISMAKTIDDKCKISIRRTGKRNNEVNLLEIIKIVVDKIGGEYGGHAYNAAGALINQDKEEEFIKNVRQVLEKNFIKA